MVPQLIVFSNGVGAASADNMNTWVQGGCLLTILQGFVGVPNMTVYAIGGVAPGDGLQGPFYWNATWQGTADNVNSVQPYGNFVGAWLRLLTIGAILLNPSSVVPVTGSTLGAAQVVGGLLNLTGTPGPCTLTIPTAAAIVAALSAPVTNGSFNWRIQNTTTSIMTFLAGAGVTLMGNLASSTTFTLNGGTTKTIVVQVTSYVSGSQAITMWCP